jgi:inosose dehydratase
MSGVDACTLSIGTYGMPGVRLEEAIVVIADAGFDGVEIAARSDYDGAPASMSSQRRRAVRRLLDESNLVLTALMENLRPATRDSEHKTQLERLKRIGELANDLTPDQTPPVQTTLGSGNWIEKRNLFRDRLGDWTDVLSEAGVVLAVKPHRGGAMSRPEEAVWLIVQLGNTRWLRMVYDYSHYAFREMSVEDTVAASLPYTAHIAVKDAVRKGDRVAFELPGESATFDYAHLLRLFYEGGYRADVCCEVSGMVSKAVGYDPARAARICYHRMARAMRRAGVPRARKAS